MHVCQWECRSLKPFSQEDPEPPSYLLIAQVKSGGWGEAIGLGRKSPSLQGRGTSHQTDQKTYVTYKPFSNFDITLFFSPGMLSNRALPEAVCIMTVAMT